MVRKNRIVIIFLLAFGIIADALSIIVAKRDTVTGIVIPELLVLGALFVLQETWRWARMVVILVAGILISIRLWHFVHASQMARFSYFVRENIFVAPAVPLYVAIIFITLTGYWLARTYNLFR